MITGGLVCAGGLIVTIVSATAASGGGRYVFAWGAILVGAVQFVRGLITYGNHVDPGSPQAAAPAVPLEQMRSLTGQSVQTTQSYELPPPQTAKSVGQSVHATLGYGLPPPQAAKAPITRAVESFAPQERVLIEALVGSVRHASAVTAPELGAIHSTLLNRLGASLSENELRELARARGRADAEAVGALIANSSGILDPQMRATIIRGVFFVMMANGPRPYAMPMAVKLGSAIGLSEGQVKELVSDMAGSLDGQPREVTLKLNPNEAREGQPVSFRYSALVSCTACGGMGADCEVCKEAGRVSSEQLIKVPLPTDLKNGERLRCDARGDAPLSGGRPGDLFIRISVEAS